VVLVALAVLLAVVFKTFLVAAFYIPSGSMESTLNISDRVLVEKVSYRFGDIDHGDVVVFVHDEAGAEPAGPATRWPASSPASARPSAWSRRRTATSSSGSSACPATPSTATAR
jgi:signal peptidase I